MLGLDDAGKTTLLQMLTEGRFSQNLPTMHAHRQEAVVGNVTFTAIDVGGHLQVNIHSTIKSVLDYILAKILQVRRTWRDFCAPADAVVFLIDASNTSRFAESKAELDSLLADEEVSKASASLNALRLCKYVGRKESSCNIRSTIIYIQLQSTPVLILGNKIDVPTAVSELELKTIFDLHTKTTGKTLLSWRDEHPQRPVEVFMCSVVKGQGYGEAFRWLMQFF